MPPLPPNRPNTKRTLEDSDTSSQAPSIVGSSSQQGSIRTSTISIRSSKHGRLRRKERNIGRRQLQAAMKHGVAQLVGVDRVKYTHDGLVFVIGQDGTEVTSYYQSLDMPFRRIQELEHNAHDEAKAQMHNNAIVYCKSHTVLLVDTSGSMRNSDVHGSRTRLSAVWLAIAEDFIRHRIESDVSSLQDAISIVLMGEQATLILHKVPTDWITYNYILKIHKKGVFIPGGHGCYGPALRMAHDILMEYESADCQLMLVVLSDGRPSDGSIKNGQDRVKPKEKINSLVENMSSCLGKRFNLRTIGMGSADQFETLHDMTEVAQNFGSFGAFQLPSLSTSGLGAAMSSISTSLTESLSSFNDGNSKFRQMRIVRRENKKMIPLLTEEVNEQDFFIFGRKDVTRMELVNDIFEDRPLHHPAAQGVAIRKLAFGEGAERLAYQFFEVAADGKTVVGEPLVAKDSRYSFKQEDGADPVVPMNKFCRRFCRIQRQAAKTEKAFNAKLDTIPNLVSDTARVSFLPCSVYYLNHPTEGLKPYIVERKITEDFEKWNSNNGWAQCAKRITRNVSLPQVIPLQIIKEEEGDDDDDDYNDEPSREPNAVSFRHDEVAQAFSHFSYIHGGRKTLICDLQGAFNRVGKVLVLTDPVIHFFDPSKDHKRGVYGRTDRGEKGIADFLRNHECNGLCDLMCKGFFTATKLPPAKRQKTNGEADGSFGVN